MSKYISIHINNGEPVLHASNSTNLDLIQDQEVIIKFYKDGSYYEDNAVILPLNEDKSENNDLSQHDISKIEILRSITPHDQQIIDNHNKTSKEVMSKSIDLVNKHSLDMKLIETKISHDNKVLTIVFTAEERVDFRELLRDLAKTFKRQIRLRQIGPRDHAKIIGGFGKCGREQCCSSHLEDLGGITMEMARLQDITSKGASKISGNCGKLLCCLSYELEVYKKLRETLPKPGTHVKTPEGKGIVTDIEVLKQTVKVSFPKKKNKTDSDSEKTNYSYFPISSIKTVKN